MEADLYVYITIILTLHLRHFQLSNANQRNQKTLVQCAINHPSLAPESSPLSRTSRSRAPETSAKPCTLPWYPEARICRSMTAECLIIMYPFYPTGNLVHIFRLGNNHSTCPQALLRSHEFWRWSSIYLNCHWNQSRTSVRFGCIWNWT